MKRDAYIVIERFSRYELADAVSHKIEFGYVPMGGVCMCVRSAGDHVYLQSMVLKEAMA